VKRDYGKFLITILALIGVALSAQTPDPTPFSADQTELSKAEEWVLSQGNVESIAPEIGQYSDLAVTVFQSK
jgi:hypothetical protein